MHKFILTLRSLCFVVAFYTFSTVFFSFGVLTFPFPFAKRYAFISLWSHGVLWLAKIICQLRYEIQGSHHLPSSPAIIFSNHQSTWETIAFLALFPPQTWVLKHELLRIPLFGWCLALLEPIPINRNKRKSAINQVVELGTARLKAGRWVIVFPEGTRTNPAEVVPYKKGGAILASKNTDYPIVPVAHNAGYFWPRKGLLKYPGTITVRIGPAINTQGRSTNEINQLVEQWIEQTKRQLPTPSRIN